MGHLWSRYYNGETKAKKENDRPLAYSWWVAVSGPQPTPTPRPHALIQHITPSSWETVPVTLREQ